MELRWKIPNFAGMKEVETKQLITMQEVYDELMKHISRQNRTILILEIWMWILTITLFVI